MHRVHGRTAALCNAEFISELVIQNGQALWAEIIAKRVWQTDHTNSDLSQKVLLYIQK